MFALLSPDPLEDAKDFIRSLLVVDPTKRLTAKEAQVCPWFTQARVQENLRQEASQDVLSSLRDFREKNILQRTVLQVLAFHQTPEDLEQLQYEFEKLDPNHQGTIVKTDLQTALMSSGLELTPEDAAVIFDSLDFDRTGKIRSAT